MISRKDVENGNADALSRHPGADLSTAVICFSHFFAELKQHQQQDPLVCQLKDALQPLKALPSTQSWYQPLLRQYHQLWPQLLIKDGLKGHQYRPGLSCELLTICIIPLSYQPALLQQYHNHPTAGHLGHDKTAARIKQIGYWVGMLQDIVKCCQECEVCQVSTTPPKVPMVNVSIGKSWQMVSVDMLKVPLSSNNNRYLLVIQD